MTSRKVILGLVLALSGGMVSMRGRRRSPSNTQSQDTMEAKKKDRLDAEQCRRVRSPHYKR